MILSDRTRRTVVAAANAIVLSLIGAGSAHAQYCEGVFTPVYVPTPALTLQIGEIVGDGPVHYLWATPPECPSSLPDCMRRLGDPAGCKPGQYRCMGNRQYLVPGDRVAAVSTINGHMCIEVPVPSDEPRAAGWISVDRVRIDANAGVRPLEWWLGGWQARDTHIDLWKEKDALRATGNAVYRSFSPKSARIDGTVAVKSDGLLYTDDNGCEVKLAAFGEQIVAVDNGRCGSHPASFGGFYTRHRVAAK